MWQNNRWQSYKYLKGIRSKVYLGWGIKLANNGCDKDFTQMERHLKLETIINVIERYWLRWGLRKFITQSKHAICIMFWLWQNASLPLPTWYFTLLLKVEGKYKIILVYKHWQYTISTSILIETVYFVMIDQNDHSSNVIEWKYNMKFGALTLIGYYLWN